MGSLRATHEHLLIAVRVLTGSHGFALYFGMKKLATTTKRQSRSKFKKTTQGASVNTKNNKYRGQGR
jgi:hypothetical protein